MPKVISFRTEFALLHRSGGALRTCSLSAAEWFDLLCCRCAWWWNTQREDHCTMVKICSLHCQPLWALLIHRNVSLSKKVSKVLWKNCESFVMWLSASLRSVAWRADLHWVQCGSRHQLVFAMRERSRVSSRHETKAANTQRPQTSKVSSVSWTRMSTRFYWCFFCRRRWRYCLFLETLLCLIAVCCWYKEVLCWRSVISEQPATHIPTWLTTRAALLGWHQKSLKVNHETWPRTNWKEKRCFHPSPD